MYLFAHLNALWHKELQALLDIIKQNVLDLFLRLVYNGNDERRYRMTIGDKIQTLRKSRQMSQEELGRNLAVSRQTVSLWETGQTLPTLDNLVRLREVFGVSIDDILCEEKEIEKKKDVSEPIESYDFVWTEDTWRKLKRKHTKKMVFQTVISTIAYIVVYIMLENMDISPTLAMLYLISLAVWVIKTCKAFSTASKYWKEEGQRLTDRACRYDIFSDYMTVRVSSKGELIKTEKIYYSQIEKTSMESGLLHINVKGNVSYIFNASDVGKETYLGHVCSVNTASKETVAPKGALRVVSIILFVCSILALEAGLIGVVILSVVNKAFVENMWVFFCFVPVPVASVVFGIYLKKKGHKFKKNIIVGIIMTPLLCIYGSFSFVFADMYSHSEEPILMAEKMLDIDIPAHSQINTQDWTKGTQTVSRGYVFSESEVYFKEKDAKPFENSLASDDKWLSSVPNDLIGITSHFCDSKFDYCIIYNVDTNEFNQLPSEAGKYRFINVIYHSADNEMLIVEYEIEYVK